MTTPLTYEQREILARHLNALNRRAHIYDGGGRSDLAAEVTEQYFALFHAIQRATSPHVYGAATAHDLDTIDRALAAPLS